MNKTILKTGVLSLVLFMVLPFKNFTKAQNIKEDLFEINKAYQEAPEFSLEIAIETKLKGKAKDSIIEKSEGFVRKKDVLLHNRIGYIESVRTASMVLSVNHNNKTMFVSEPSNSISFSSGEITGSIDRALKISSSTTFSENKTTGHYVIYFSESPLKRLEFTFDKKSKFITQILITEPYIPETELVNPDKNPWLEYEYSVVFDKITVTPEFLKTDFSTWEFLYQKGNEFVASQKYSDYKIINQIPAK